MNFSIVFENTGDSLPFESCSSKTAEVLSYYVDYLNDKNLNKFIIPEVGNKIQTAITNLDSTLHETNKWIYELIDGYIETYTDGSNYLNQQVLNKLHSDWVNSQIVLSYNIQEKRKKYNSAQTEMIHNMYPDEIANTAVGVIAEKLGHGKLYDSINTNTHALESIFDNIKCRIAGQDRVEFNNPFPKSVLNNNISNFSLAFCHLGRTLYDKFDRFDMNLEYNDENSYNELTGFVDINLLNPQTIPLSKEYIAWCNSHNKVPIGDKFNIGNIKNLINRLTDYRKIIFQNTLHSNAFSIQLTKG